MEWSCSMMNHMFLGSDRSRWMSVGWGMVSRRKACEGASKSMSKYLGLPLFMIQIGI